MCGPRNDWSLSTPTPQTPPSGGRGERPEPACARDVEDRPGAARDLAAGEGGALRSVDEVVRVVDQHLDARCGCVGAGGEADDEVLDRAEPSPRPRCRRRRGRGGAARAFQRASRRDTQPRSSGRRRPGGSAAAAEDRAGRVHQGEGHSGMARARPAWKAGSKYCPNVMTSSYRCRAMQTEEVSAALLERRRHDPPGDPGQAHAPLRIPSHSWSVPRVRAPTAPVEHEDDLWARCGARSPCAADPPSAPAAATNPATPRHAIRKREPRIGAT